MSYTRAATLLFTHGFDLSLLRIQLRLKSLNNAGDFLWLRPCRLTLRMQPLSVGPIIGTRDIATSPNRSPRCHRLRKAALVVSVWRLSAGAVTTTLVRFSIVMGKAILRYLVDPAVRRERSLKPSTTRTLKI